MFFFSFFLSFPRNWSSSEINIISIGGKIIFLEKPQGEISVGGKGWESRAFGSEVAKTKRRQS